MRSTVSGKFTCDALREESARELLRESNLMIFRPY